MIDKNKILQDFNNQTSPTFSKRRPKIEESPEQPIQENPVDFQEKKRDMTASSPIGFKAFTTNVYASPAEYFLWQTIGKPLTQMGYAVFNTIAFERDTEDLREFVILRFDITNVPSHFGDGGTMMRDSDCDINVIGKGTVHDSAVQEITNIIHEILDNNQISYNTPLKSYDFEENTTEIVTSLTYQYIRSQV